MHVVLNNNHIEIDGEITEKQVAPFAPQLSTGSTEFKNYAPSSIEEWRDLRSGLGKESDEKNSGRLYWSTSIETTKDGYLTLGPLVTTAGSFGVQPIKILDFNGSGSMKTYAFGNSVGSVWNTGTSAWDEADSSALATPTDAIVVTDGTATYLLVCNGTEIRYTSDGSSWSQMTTENVKYMCTFDNRLIGVDAAYKKIWYSPRDNIDGTLASFAITGDFSTITDIFSGKSLVTGEPVIYLVTDTQPYILDFYSQTLHPQEVRYPSTSNARVGMYWNGTVFVGTGAGITRVTSNLVDPSYGPNADDGLPETYQGYVYDMDSSSYWMIIAVAGGTQDSIFKRHMSMGGWHQIYSSTSAIECVSFSPAHSPGRLWFGDGTNIKYIDFPDKTHDVTKVTGYDFAASGELYLPTMSRVSSMPKVAIKMEAIAADLSTDEKVTPYYIVNDGISLTDGDWTALSAWTSGARPSSSFGSSLGTAFYDLSIKLKFERGATTTNSPKIKSIALYYLPLPTTVTAWVFKVKALGSGSRKLIDDLVSARNATTLINFSPDNDINKSEHYVRIVSMPNKRWLNRYAEEKDFTITVSEVA